MNDNYGDRVDLYHSVLSGFYKIVKVAGISEGDNIERATDKIVALVQLGLLHANTTQQSDLYKTIVEKFYAYGVEESDEEIRNRIMFILDLYYGMGLEKYEEILSQFATQNQNDET